MGGRSDDVDVYTRISLGIAACTVVLTASFLGVVAIMSRSVEGVQSRVPWYLLIGAVVFVAFIVILEQYGATGREIILTATVSGVVGLALGALAVEGVIFTVRYPGEVFVSRLVVYFLAAGLIGTGVAYWALRHWREFTDRNRRHV